MAAAISAKGKQTSQISIALAKSLDDSWTLLKEYFDVVGVVVRDTRDALAGYLNDSQGGVWVANCDGEPAGCIILRPLISTTFADDKGGEIKRLWVRPQFRRLGIASQLLTALESHAVSVGYNRLYLDSKDDLLEAITFYKRAGYVACDRYNDNPQATVFLTKQLSRVITVREFRDGDEAAFWSLNNAWISKLFKLEQKDIETLRDPRTYILAKGGRIYLACRNDEKLGCCALMKMADGSYELAKMGVAESERGKGIGRLILQHVIDQARRLRIPRLYLETNHTLSNAIHLYESVGFRRLKPEEVTPSPYRRADVYMHMLLD